MIGLFMANSLCAFVTVLNYIIIIMTCAGDKEMGMSCHLVTGIMSLLVVDVEVCMYVWVRRT